jgi:hypothetical protein
LNLDSMDQEHSCSTWHKLGKVTNAMASVSFFVH